MHARSPAETGSTGHTATYRRGCHASAHLLVDAATLRQPCYHAKAFEWLPTREPSIPITEAIGTVGDAVIVIPV